MQALRSPSKASTPTFPRDPWTAEVQADFAKLRSEIAQLTQRHREALEALEDACDQRDSIKKQRDAAMLDRDYWMQLARAEAERADSAQPLSKGERCLWRLVAAALLVGWGVVIGARL